MTAHQFAKQLLSGPDLEIVVPKVMEYSDDDDDSCASPTVMEHDGEETVTGAPCKVLVISYRELKQNV